MSTNPPPDDFALRRLVDSSGFAFQLAVEDLVRSSGARWKVLFSEYAWLHPDRNSEGFIDTVLEKDRTRLVIECKRTSADAHWVFLNPLQTSAAVVCWTASTAQMPIGGQGFDRVMCEPESPVCCSTPLPMPGQAQPFR